MAGFIAGTGKGRNGKGMYGLAPGIKILNISMGQIENKAGNDGQNRDPVEYPAAFPGVVGGCGIVHPRDALAHPGGPGPADVDPLLPAAVSAVGPAVCPEGGGGAGRVRSGFLIPPPQAGFVLVCHGCPADRPENLSGDLPG